MAFLHVRLPLATHSRVYGVTTTETIVRQSKTYDSLGTLIVLLQRRGLPNALGVSEMLFSTNISLNFTQNTQDSDTDTVERKQKITCGLSTVSIQ